MSDVWDFYFARVNGEIASLFVDLGIRDAVPDRKRPFLLWTWVYLQEPRKDGLPNSEESQVLQTIEDALAAAVKEKLDADLVSRITTAGRRELYFDPSGFLMGTGLIRHSGSRWRF